MRRVDIVFVAMLLLFAASLRFIGITYGEPEMTLHPSDAVRNLLPLETPIHPDEYFYVSIPLDMLSKRTVNPDFFENPAFLIDLNFATYALTGAGQGLSPERFRDLNQRQFAPFPLYVIGRVYSALGGMLAVAAAYGAARLLAGRFAALVAGLLAAVSLLLVQHAHYATTSSLAAGFTILTVWATLIFWKRRETRWLLLAGAAAGLATANRYNAGVIVILVFAAALLNLWQRRTRGALMMAFGAAAALAGIFFVVNPYIIIRFSRFWEDFRYITSSYVAGEGTPYGLFFELRYLILFGLGIPAAVCTLFGFWHLRRQTIPLLISLYLLVYALFVLRTVRPGHSDQLLVPLIPVLSLFAGVGAFWVSQRLQMRGMVRVGLVAALVVVPLSLTLPIVRMFTLPDTRITLEKWIYEHLPPGSSIHLTGPYNVPLDPAIYPWAQTYAGDLKPIADLQAENVDYVIVSDAWFYDEARSSEIKDAVHLQTLRDYVMGYDSLPLVARMERLAIPGSEWMMHTATVWHNPALSVYCLNEVSCSAVR